MKILCVLTILFAGVSMLSFTVSNAEMGDNDEGAVYMNTSNGNTMESIGGGQYVNDDGSISQMDDLGGGQLMTGDGDMVQDMGAGTYMTEDGEFITDMDDSI